jgi:threonyl-tRNA synthetase
MSEAGSDSIRITLPDGSQRETPRGSTVEDVARSIGPRLAKAAVAGKVDGELVDVYYPLETDCSVEIVTPPSPDAMEVYRHTSAHILANAVKELWPEVKIGVGPVIETGFYYDFERDKPFSEEELEAIEAKMQEIIDRDNPVRRFVQPKQEAMDFFDGWGDDLKVQLIDEKGGPEVSCYRQGDFVDFCLGPHLPSTGRVKAFKLTSVSGAYWKGDQANQQLQRVYGTAFFSKKDLEQHLALLEEAKARDHRKLGKELDLFSFHPQAPASPFFHPKGATVYNLLVNYVRGRYHEYGYQEVITPEIFDSSLWHDSGHYENYKENMFFTQVDEREFAVKPMNCPSHVLLYRAGLHSYRDLPLRLADFGRLHRYELSGVTAGLTRVRSFSQDDAHIFCTPDQIESEVRSVTKMFLETYELVDFQDVQIYLSTRPEKSMGAPEAWERAEAALAAALDAQGAEYQMDPGGGAFYGPKIDFKVHDALKREHQLGTIQLDYQLPERFDLHYVAPSGGHEQPVMIHRAMLGSLERFLGILIEHLAGAFPVWLAPVQVAVLPITDRALAYCEEVAGRLDGSGFRTEVDRRQEKIGFKIRSARLQKVPVMLVVGDREAEAGTVALRTRAEGDQGPLTLDDLIPRMQEAVDRRWQELLPPAAAADHPEKGEVQ